MKTEPRRLVPRTLPGRIGMGFGFGTLAVILLLFVMSDNITDGGSRPAPIWLRATVFASVLIMAVPAVMVGFRARKVDRSILGTVALVLACVLGAWFTLTGLDHLFME